MLESRWFISRVTARAFKSVGSCRLNVSFKPGLTCIVGPNGSGKSNLLDAVCFACGSSPLPVGVRRLADLQCTDVQEVRRQLFVKQQRLRTCRRRSLIQTSPISAHLHISSATAVKLLVQFVTLAGLRSTSGHH